MSSTQIESLSHRPLRVGIVSPCPPPYGGITRIVENNLAFWDDQDVEPFFLPFQVPEGAEGPADAEFHSLESRGKKSWGALRKSMNVLARAPIARPGGYLRFVRYNMALAHFIREREIDVVYAHEVWPNGASAVLQSRINGVGSVVVAYGETIGTDAHFKRQRRVGMHAVRSAHEVVSTSEHCLKAALALGADPDHATVVYAGVDLERFNPRVSGEEFRREWGVTEETLVVSVLGHVLRRKLEVLLDAMDRVDPNVPVCYVIGGSGSDLEWVKGRMAAHPERNVVLAGFVPEEKLPEFYAATDALVVSPNTLFECMGQSIKEAMAIGTAVVGPRLGGIVEAIDHGNNGLLYEADDPDDLANALTSLAGDPELRHKFGSSGRKIAEDKFDAQTAADRTLEVLRGAAVQAGRH